MPDIVNSSATTAVITLGTSVTGTIETVGDHDWYRVDLVAGTTYDFRLHGFGLTDLPGTTLRLVGIDGVTQVDYNSGSASWAGTNTTDSRIASYTALTTGTYFIDVGGAAGTGDFLLTAVPRNNLGMVFTSDEIAWQLINNYNDQFYEAVAWNVGIDNALTVNITGLDATAQNLAINALKAWSDVTGITFTQVANGAEITFGSSAGGLDAYTSWAVSGSTITSATIEITTGWVNTYGSGLASYSFETYMHEIGHALGLGHGGNYNGNATYGVDNYYLNDSVQYSIMSYFQALNGEGNDSNTFLNGDFRYMFTPAIADILAVERLYGGSTTTRSADTTYGYNSNTGNAALDGAVNSLSDMFFVIHDDGGVDTIDASGAGVAVQLNLVAESFSNFGGISNVSISRGTVVENAKGGSGGDTLTGNEIANVLSGNGGSDTLNGAGGDDTLIGGAGGDALIGGGGIDTAYYYDSVGGVTLNLALNTASGGDAAGDTLSSIENVIGSNTGGDTLTGDGGANFLSSFGGADTLDGGAGGDSLFGGDGNDILKPGAGFDYAVGGNGNDTVDYSTSAAGVGVHLFFQGGFGGDAAGDGITGVENVIGSNIGADFLYGDAAVNVLTGLGGDDTFYGDLGNDTLDGGAGTGDTAYYFLSTAAVTVNLALGTGLGGTAQGDTLISIENVIGSRDYNDTLTGDAGINFINGYGGSDTIIGGGGNDTLFGGVSDDTFRYTTTNFGFDVIGDFEKGIDHISFATGVAINFAGLTLTLVDADTVFVSVNGTPTEGITVNSATPFTMNASDFLFV